MPLPISRGLDPSALQGVGVVVHCAAETAGGKEDHRRNSIEATRQVLEAAARAGVKRVVHVSSLAILKSSREVGRPLDEDAPVDVDSMQRGPYVWGKAESERLAQRLGEELRHRRPSRSTGAFVDYGAYQPPGRLGREIGPFFVAMGPKRGALSVCDVATAARVIRSYVEDFESAPRLLNLVEAPPPSRRELLARFTADRRDLRVFWFPAVLLRMLSGPLKRDAARGPRIEPAGRRRRGICERTVTVCDLALRTIERAGPSAVTRTSDAAREVRS